MPFRENIVTLPLILNMSQYFEQSPYEQIDTKKNLKKFNLFLQKKIYVTNDISLNQHSFQLFNTKKQSSNIKRFCPLI